MMTVPSIMMTLMKIIIIIIVIVFHDDDFDENHDHHCDCLSNLSVLGLCERLLGRVGGTTFLIFEQYGWVVDEIVLMC